MLLFFDVLFLKLLLLANFYVLFAKSRWLFYSFAMFGLVYRWGSSMLTRPTPFPFKNHEHIVSPRKFCEKNTVRKAFSLSYLTLPTELHPLQAGRFSHSPFVTTERGSRPTPHQAFIDNKNSSLSLVTFKRS